MKITELKTQINLGQFPTDFPHFGGANLIITNDPNRNYHEGDVVVYSEHAGALSWLVVELKKIYDAKLNSLNKFEFYPYIGELIQASVKQNDDLFETMLFVVDKIEKDWGSY
ncbi:MAG: hypothetical protein LW688_02725 [Cryomorphaceae bacterium]|jgi:hypothetical protein|nr:hypothetical protein [Cryomorphaceae bacterium]